MRLFGMADSDFFVPACSCARLFMLPLKKYVHYFAVQIHTARAEFCRGSHGHLGQLLGKLNLAVIILEVKKIELRSEEHTSELQSLMRISYAVFCLTKKKKKTSTHYSKNIRYTKM